MTISKSKIGEASVEGVASAPSASEGIPPVTAGFEATQARFAQGLEKAIKTAEDLVAFNQGNVEAVLKSSQILASGVHDLSRHFAASAQASLDDGFSAFKALSGAKSLKDAFELQSSFARATVEKSLAASGKLTDASLKLTEQALAPLTARVTVAVERFAKPA